MNTVTTKRFTQALQETIYDSCSHKLRNIQTEVR